MSALGVLDRAEIAGEGQLLLVGEALVAQHQHGAAIHPRLDRRHLLARQRLRRVDPRQFAGKTGMERADGEGHERTPFASRR